MYFREVRLVRILAADREPRCAGAQFSDRGQIVGPEIIDHLERDLLHPRRRRRPPGEHVVTTLAHREALPLDQRLVLAQEQTDVEILPFGHALDLIGLDIRIVWYMFEEERVLARDKELRTARIALAAGAAPQLMIDAAAVVTIGPDDVQAAELGDAGAKDDIHAAAGHVGRDRHGTANAGARHDLSFARFVSRVQHVMRKIAEPAAEPLGLFDTRRADEHGTAAGVQAADLVDDRGLLLRSGRKQPIRFVDTHDRSMRLDWRDAEI